MPALLIVLSCLNSLTASITQLTPSRLSSIITYHSLPANVAILWSDSFSFLGTLPSTDGIAFAAGRFPCRSCFAMAFVLLIATI